MQTYAEVILLRLGIFATKALRHEGKREKIVPLQLKFLAICEIRRDITLNHPCILKGKVSFCKANFHYYNIGR